MTTVYARSGGITAAVITGSGSSRLHKNGKGNATVLRIARDGTGSNSKMEIGPVVKVINPAPVAIASDALIVITQDDSRAWIVVNEICE